MSLFALVLSCADDSLDPLQMNAVKKGTILALRGQQLQNIYFEGKPGTEIFPKIYSGNEVFAFDAEILAEDPSTLESFDIFVIKRTKTGSSFTTQRLPLRNVPFSEFNETDDYVRPWVSVSIDFDDILDVVGLDPSSPTFAADMLANYPTGMSIEMDLNLVDGSKVLASQIVAAGLFQSNQFYPAQRLNIAITDYCSYDGSSWTGTYSATETSEFFGGYGPYDVAVTADGATADKYLVDNWYDSGIPIYFTMNPSTDVETQTATIPSQPNPNNTARTIEGTGTYNECTKTITFNMTYKQGDTVLDQLLWKIVKQ